MKQAFNPKKRDTKKGEVLRYLFDFEQGFKTIDEISTLTNCNKYYALSILKVHVTHYKDATDEEQENNLRLLAYLTQKDNKIIISRPLEIGDINKNYEI